MSWVYRMMRGFYVGAIRPLLFLADSETVHLWAMSLGEFFGRSALARKIMAFFFRRAEPLLESKVAGIAFKTPLGLAAGFDYEARLPKILRKPSALRPLAIIVNKNSIKI